MIWDSPYFQNVASDFVTLTILVAFGSAVYRFSHRRKMLQFFECSDSRRLTIYLSNLTFDQGRAIDLQGQSRGHHGSAVPGYEARLVASAYRAFLAPMPGLNDQRGFLRFLALRDLELVVEPSPRRSAALTTTGSLITMGSGAYNVATFVAECAGDASVSWESGITVRDCRSNFTGEGFALLQKVYDPDREQWLFEVAGISSAGTSAAYLHLLNNWSQLLRRFGHGIGSEFLQVIELGDGPGFRGTVRYEFFPGRSSPTPQKGRLHRLRGRSSRTVADLAARPYDDGS